jgi:hypothetical protein
VQLVSLLLVMGVVVVLALVVGFAILASPIFAAVIFIVAFAGFLVWRGSRRTRPAGPGDPSRQVPTTEEASRTTEAPTRG